MKRTVHLLSATIVLPLIMTGCANVKPWDRDILADYTMRPDRDQVALFHYADLEVDLIGEMERLARVSEIDISAERVRELAAAAGFEAMKERSRDLGQ